MSGFDTVEHVLITFIAVMIAGVVALAVIGVGIAFAAAPGVTSIAVGCALLVALVAWRLTA